MTGAVTSVSQQGMTATIPTTLATVALPFSLCNLTSFTVVYCLTVKEEWGKLISITICCLLPLLTGQAAASPIRHPTTPTGIGNPPQERLCCQPCLKDGMGKLLQGRDCYSSTRQKEISNHHVNPCLPLRL